MEKIVGDLSSRCYSVGKLLRLDCSAGLPVPLFWILAH
jgi:hypothetical protein